MRENLLVLILLALASIIVFRDSFNTFFAQDDFILINEFSQNDLLTDIKNAFGPPKVTHFRPIHNLYFLIAGNIFGKNYFVYHILKLSIHILTGFLIYKIIKKIIQSKSLGVISGLIYVTHPVHFVSLYWISGGATTTGPILFLSSVYMFLKNRARLSLALFTLSLLASEATVFASLIFPIYQYLFAKKLDASFSKKIAVILAIFLPLKLFFLTPRTTFDVYSLNFSPEVMYAFTYYLARILGFVENATAFPVSILLTTWILVITGFFIMHLKRILKDSTAILFFTSIILAGLMPYIFLPTHLSPHYMNLSVIGFSALAALIIVNMRPLIVIILSVVFVLISTLSVAKIEQNNWVIQRSKVAKNYIDKIELSNLPIDSTIIFNDNPISSSYEAYISLGTGKALDFWFKDKNYKSCFTWIENCENVQ